MSRKQFWRVSICTVCTLGLVWSTSCGPVVSDTGFQGSWERRHGGGDSVVSMWEDQGELYFQFRRRTGNVSVRCGDPEVCTEYFEDEPIYEWRFNVTRTDEPTRLLVAVSGTPLDGASTPLSYVDRIELQPGALEITSTTVERNGEPLPRETGVYRFTKRADDPFY